MPLKSLTFVLIALCLALVEVACVPIPHRYQYDPNIQGRVELDEASQRPSIARLYRCASPSNGCASEQEVDVASVEESGEFSLEGSRKFAAYTPSMGHCNWRWNVKFFDKNSEFLGSHTFGGYGPCVAPNTVQLECSAQDDGVVRCESSGT